MKIAVISFMGGVGKTLLSSYVLAPRMSDTPFYSVESINRSAVDLGLMNVVTFAGRQFSELLEEIVFEDNAIVDVGVSNVEAFFAAMGKYDQGANEFDRYIIPVCPEVRTQEEAIKTALTLVKAGVDKKKIFFVPNRYNTAESFESQYSVLESFSIQEKIGHFKKDYAINDSAVYEYLADERMSFSELLKESENAEAFKAAAKVETDKEKRRELAHKYTNMKLAVLVQKNLDNAYKALIGA